MQSQTFAALGEPSRFRIVELLQRGPLAVGEIAESLAIRQPQVSKHLNVLSRAGLVGMRPVARRRIYHLEADQFELIADWVGTFERTWEARLDSLDMYLKSLDAEDGT